MRIEPPPSLAWATGTMPAATAAAEPPLDPPVERARSQGLRVGPYAFGSVVGRIPSSGVFVLPIVTKPASRKRMREVGVDGRAEVRVLEQLHAHVERLAGERRAEVLEQERNALERAVGQVARGRLARPRRRACG